MIQSQNEAVTHSPRPDGLNCCNGSTRPPHRTKASRPLHHRPESGWFTRVLRGRFPDPNIVYALVTIWLRILTPYLLPPQKECMIEKANVVEHLPILKLNVHDFCDMPNWLRVGSWVDWHYLPCVDKKCPWPRDDFERGMSASTIPFYIRSILVALADNISLQSSPAGSRTHVGGQFDPGPHCRRCLARPIT